MTTRDQVRFADKVFRTVLLTFVFLFFATMVGLWGTNLPASTWLPIAVVVSVILGYIADRLLPQIQQRGE